MYLQSNKQMDVDLCLCSRTQGESRRTSETGREGIGRGEATQGSGESHHKMVPFQEVCVEHRLAWSRPNNLVAEPVPISAQYVECL